jgi:hypothetical protein
MKGQKVLLGKLEVEDRPLGDYPFNMKGENMHMISGRAHTCE